MSIATSALLSALLLVTTLSPSCSPADADELLAPLPPSTMGVIDDPPSGSGCTLGAAGPIRKMHLVVRDTVRPDVGPYAVSLPGYAAPDGAQDSFRPYLIEARPGDTLRIDLENRLGDHTVDHPFPVTDVDPGVPTDANLTNLHTHGLVVSPRPAFPCDSPGDYVFDQLPPGGTFHYRIDIPTSVVGVGGTSRQPFPSGVYWFHSHLHGLSKNQVQAGQSGVIVIDPQPGSGDPTLAIRAATDPRTLVLRDIQLAVPPGQTPDKASAKGLAAQWLHGDGYDTQACRAAANPGRPIVTGPGFCTHPGTLDSQGHYDAGTDLVWMFTVNGQLFPTITVAPGRTQLWRVANVSATVAYTLDLVDAGGAEQDLRVLSLDGVVAGTALAGDPRALHPSVTLKRLLLMPAARAEILIPNTNGNQADARLTLRTRGLETGGTGQTAPGDPATPVDRGDYAGDPWPAADLASVVLQGRGTAADARALLANTFERGEAAPLMAEAPAAAPAAPAAPDHCVTLPAGAVRRQIRFDQDSDFFFLGSEVVRADGTSVDGPGGSGPHTIAPRPFQHAIPPQAEDHVCARLGAQETWELDNVTSELHNFHIHQTKFRLARPGDPGLPPGFEAADAISDPAGIIKGQVPEFGTTAGVAAVDVWHDTIPVPPARFDGNGAMTQPGRVFVSIPFKDPAQVGTFVFHCHILEHEDSGMMAAVEVYDPAHPGASRQGADAGAAAPRHRAAFCGTPPGSFTPVLDGLDGPTWLGSLLHGARRLWPSRL